MGAVDGERYGAAEPLAVTVPHAARLLGVGKSMLYELVQRGEIPTFRLGSRIMVAREVIERIVRGEDVRRI